MQNRKIYIDWVRCPVCGSKTRDRLREDTIKKLPSLLSKM